MQKITTQNIVKISLLLSLIFVAFIIQSFIPNLPNGLGNVAIIAEMILLSGSIILGWRYALISILFYLMLGLINIPMFFNGLLYTTKTSTKIYVYLLDYFLPLISLSLSSIFKKRFKFLIINIVITNIINYLLHVTSGIIFWSSFSWKGWGPIAYSFASNAIRNSVMLATSLFLSLGLWKFPKNIFNKEQEWK